MKNLRQTIVAAIQETADMRDAVMNQALTDDTVLLDSGLDSLGFAILVARLEEDLGYDPFVMMDEPVYPQTLGEFLAIYQRFAPASSAPPQ
ncbi:MAG: acyl carrier protein [Burkholderiales bacterium]|nr:acyl carrier protein [Burkholderiales bacterium]